MQTDTKKPLNIILLGRSGSGKGTQAKLLCEKYDLEYIGSGDLLRELANKDNPISKRLKVEMAEGKLVPTWAPFYMWMDKLIHIPENKGFLFDGSPRKLNEAETLNEVFEWLGRTGIKAILIDISRDDAYNRMIQRRICTKCKNISTSKVQEKGDVVCEKCGEKMQVRPGDHPDAIEERLDWYDNETLESIEFYEKRGELIRIDGQQSIEKVFEDVVKAVEA